MPSTWSAKQVAAKIENIQVLTEAGHKNFVGGYQAVADHLIDQFEGGREVVDFTRAARVALRPCVLRVDHAIEQELPAAIGRSKVQ